jgi:photosystem II stability/assembly factor-like uncharacterized protein
MKNKLLLFASFFLLHFTLLAQQGWFQQTGISAWYPLNSVYFTDNDTGWVVTGGHTHGAIFKSTDGGTNWTYQEAQAFLYSVHFTDNGTGWAVGSEGTILNTTDGGTNWNPQSSGTEVPLGSVHFIDNNTGWAVGDIGTILNTIDGGTNWNPQSSGTTQALFSDHFTNNTSGWVAGGNGIILNTIDGGTNWNPQASGTTEYLTSVQFVNSNTGWVVGGGGIILNTTDGGTNWNSQTSGTIEDLRSVHFIDNNTGWAVGGYGITLKTVTGGVIPVELTSFTATSQTGKVYLNWTTATEINNLGFEIERKIINVSDGEWITIGFREGNGTTTDPKEYSYVDVVSDIRASSLSYRLKQIDFSGSYEYSDEVLVDNPAPSDYALEQNYPNPFNPVTIINYSLPVKSQVELVIYNVLGESVTQLVNEKQEAGKYSIEFNAAGFPSGVYLYRLQAGSIVETKKMVLMK